MTAKNLKKVEVIEFNERFCGKRQNKPLKNESDEDMQVNYKLEIPHDKTKVFNIKRARYEIMRFAVNGFDKERKTKDKIAMAIRLGAKPPKREYKNYKELIAEKIKAKESKMADLPNKYTLQKLKGRKNPKKRKKKKDQPTNLI